MQFSELRVRTRIHPDDLEAKKGLVLERSDLDVLLDGPTLISKPDGQPLAKYLPGVLKDVGAETFDVLHELKSHQTDNRGLASGTGRDASWAGRELDAASAHGRRTRSAPISSAIVGSFDAKAPKFYCRLTAWTGEEWDKYTTLFPLFREIGRHFAEQVPERYAAQMAYVVDTEAAWVITGTPFTTITVNNSYPTGVHTDSGDLEEGFSNLAVLRRGDYSGGIFTFPEYRLGVDMQDGDLLLMDAHEWHGNTRMMCDRCGDRIGPGGRDDHDVTCQTERISIVAYYRTKIRKCGTPEEEGQRAIDWREKTIALGSAVDEMAEESLVGSSGG